MRIKTFTKKRPRRARRKTWFRLALDLVLATLILSITTLVVSHLGRQAANSLSGAVRVVDGDSLELDGERIRLRGIDAFELRQTCTKDGREYGCGRESLLSLQRLVIGKQVTCETWERDRYHRLLGVCSAGGIELNRQQVSQGWAVAYGDYEREEREARREQRGAWSGDFTPPHNWRTKHGDLAEYPHNLIGAIGDWLRSLLVRWSHRPASDEEIAR